VNPFSGQAFIQAKPTPRNTNSKWNDMHSTAKQEFAKMWSDLINSPGDIKALVGSGKNEGKMLSNGNNKGGINFSSGRDVDSKVFEFISFRFLRKLNKRS
jgi:hypothetical protein